MPPTGLPATSNVGGPSPGETVQKRSVKLVGSLLVIVHVDSPPGFSLQSAPYQVWVPV